MIRIGMMPRTILLLNSKALMMKRMRPFLEKRYANWMLTLNTKEESLYIKFVFLYIKFVVLEQFYDSLTSLRHSRIMISSTKCLRMMLKSIIACVIGSRQSLQIWVSAPLPSMPTKQVYSQRYLLPLVFPKTIQPSTIYLLAILSLEKVFHALGYWIPLYFLGLLL